MAPHRKLDKVNSNNNLYNKPQQIDKFVKACFQIDADGFVQAFIDGSVTKRASLGVWFGPNHHLNYKHKVIDDVYPHETPDINVAEMMAIHKAISIVKDNGGLNLAIHTDSENIEDINLILTNRQKGMKRKTYNKCPDTVDEIVTFHKTMNIRLVKGRSRCTLQRSTHRNRMWEKDEFY